MHDQEVGRWCYDLGFRFREYEFQPQRRELRIHHPKLLRGGTVAALTFA